MKNKRNIILLLCLSLLPFTAQAQTPVALSPVPAQQFFSQAGFPLASGCIYTFITGTSTPLATFTDGTGTATNTNPIILDGGGFGNIWLSNSSYRFQIWSYGSGAVGVNCGNGSLQRTVDNVSAYTIIDQAQNLFLNGQTSDPGGTAGELIYRSDIPCFRGFTTFWDCFVRLTDPQTLSNKTLASPSITGSVSGNPNLLVPSVNGVAMQNSPATYTNLVNSSSVLNELTGINNVAGAPQWVASAPNTDVIGICVANCGATGTGTVQQGGVASCVFDNASTTADFVVLSSTTTGNCHDVGNVFPPSGQVVGRAMATTGGAGTASVLLYPPEIKTLTSGSTTGCTNFTPVTVSNNNAQQNLMSCTINANALSQGSLLEVDLQGIESAAAGQTLSLNVSLGGGTACTTQVTVGIANNQPWNAVMKLFVLTSGAGGTMNMSCEYFSSASGGGVIGPNGVLGTPTLSINTTIANTLQVTEQMSVVNAGNSVTQQGLKAVIF